MAWTLGETTFDDPAQAKEPLLQAVAGMTKGLRTVLELDAKASIRGVRNWTDLRDTRPRVLERIATDMKAKGRISPSSRPFRHRSRRSSSKDRIEQLLTCEAQLFYAVVGMASRFEENPTNTKLPNPFGGEAFPSKGGSSSRMWTSRAGSRR